MYFLCRKQVFLYSLTSLGNFLFFLFKINRKYKKLNDKSNCGKRIKHTTFLWQFFVNEFLISFEQRKTFRWNFCWVTIIIRRVFIVFFPFLFYIKEFKIYWIYRALCPLIITWWREWLVNSSRKNNNVLSILCFVYFFISI